MAMPRLSVLIFGLRSHDGPYLVRDEPTAARTVGDVVRHLSERLGVRFVACDETDLESDTYMFHVYECDKSCGLVVITVRRDFWWLRPKQRLDFELCDDDAISVGTAV
jgi:hypothetical protein